MSSPPQTSRRMRLRRVDSFRRLSSLPENLNTWFFTDKHLHIEIEGFLEDLVHEHNALLKSILSTMIIPGTSSGLDFTIPQQLPHELHQFFTQFCGKFESLLGEELEKRGVSNDEFEAVMAIAALEERRDGVHFYRWVDVLSMDIFVRMLAVGLRLDDAVSNLSAQQQSPLSSSVVSTVTSPNQQHKDTSTFSKEEFPVMKAAITAVAKRSDVARASRRRRTNLKPILFSWSPPDFSSILRMIDACSPPPSAYRLPKSVLKELARWRNRLSSKTLNSNGVYGTQPRNDDDWLRYLELLCEAMPDDVFAAFVARMNEYVKEDAASRSPAEMLAMLDRRSVWELFSTLDVTCTDRVDLHDWLSEIATDNVKRKLFSDSSSSADQPPTAEEANRLDRALHKLTLRCLAEYRTNHGNDSYVQQMAELEANRKARRDESANGASSSCLQPIASGSSFTKGAGNVASLVASASLAATSSSSSSPSPLSPKQQDVKEMRHMCELQAPLTLTEFTHIVQLTYQMASEQFKSTNDVRSMCAALRQDVVE